MVIDLQNKLFDWFAIDQNKRLIRTLVDLILGFTVPLERAFYSFEFSFLFYF